MSRVDSLSYFALGSHGQTLNLKDNRLSLKDASHLRLVASLDELFHCIIAEWFKLKTTIKDRDTEIV